MKLVVYKQTAPNEAAEFGNPCGIDNYRDL
jgi:hypothetical protein